MSDPFCPRCGRASRPMETPGLRCDCPEILEASLGGLRKGKWVVATLALMSQRTLDEIQERADRAVREAMIAGYELGLRGGVPPENVKTCSKCRKVYFVASPLERQIEECIECFTKENP